MTKEELEQIQEAYEAKMENNKLVRAELDADVDINPFKFGPILHIGIRTLGDIIFHTVINREPTFFENGEYQTIAGKRRTIEDTYKLQKVYNIKCRFKDIKVAFQCLEDNELLTVVFCKKTLVKTYSRYKYGTLIEEVNNCLNKNEKNFEIKKPKLSKTNKAFKKRLY